eukprot:1160788-Pelagomonas_calceolata.AAC.12
MAGSIQKHCIASCTWWHSIWPRSYKKHVARFCGSPMLGSMQSVALFAHACMCVCVCLTAGSMQQRCMAICTWWHVGLDHG